LVKIVTMCDRGLTRSVGLADVLKRHFEPTDVIPIGCLENTKETLVMLFEWADKIVIMRGRMIESVPAEYHYKTLVCEVGEDTYGDSKNRSLIDQCWDWTRLNINNLEIKEHNR